jgi:hypothetical protein
MLIILAMIAGAVIIGAVAYALGRSAIAGVIETMAGADGSS